MWEQRILLLCRFPELKSRFCYLQYIKFILFVAFATVPKFIRLLLLLLFGSAAFAEWIGL
jgi:hypothetical protein